VFLLGKEKRHREALKLYLSKKEFKLAEEYCSEKNEKLLTVLFEIYVQLYYETKTKHPEKV